MVVREIYARLGIKVDPKGKGEAKLFFTEIRSAMELMVKAVEVAKDVIQDLVGETVDYAKEINRAAKMTGLSRDSLQELGFAAKESGVDFGTLQSALLRLQRQGFGKADEKLLSLVDTFDKVKDPADRAKLAFQYFGKGFESMLPFLAQGKERISELISEGHELGVVMKDEDLAAAAKLNKGLKLWHATLEGLKRTIAGPFLQSASKAIGEFNKWVRVNREWLASNITWALQKTADVLRAVWQVARSAADGLGWLAERFGKASVAVAIFAGAMLLAGGSTTMLTLGWIAIAAIIALVTDDIIAFMKGQPSLLGDIAAAFDTLLQKLNDPEFTKQHPIQAFFTSLLETIINIRKEWKMTLDYIKNSTGARVKEGLNSGPIKLGTDPDKKAAFDSWAGAMKPPIDIGAMPKENPSWWTSLFPAGAAAPGASPGPINLNRDPSGGGGAPTIINLGGVHVSAQTDADPTEIANLAAKACDERIQSCIGNARAALVPAPAE